MTPASHTVLCVDDERNIQSALRRLLRRESYRLLTCSSGEEALSLLRREAVQLIISDQRMPGMTGTDLLACVREAFPGIIRIILTGYTEIDAITEAINDGHVYKIFFKPWNDQNLKLEIRQTLDQYDLKMANKHLHETIVDQNEQLRKINDSLERRVRERTREIELQNRVLELSRTILDDLPIPIVGVSAEGFIVMLNQEVSRLRGAGKPIALGQSAEACFGDEIHAAIQDTFVRGERKTLPALRVADARYLVDLIPLSGKFKGKGTMMVFSQQRRT